MTPSTHRPPSRIGWTVFVILCLLFLGLMIGTAIGSRFVPAGSGLAGPGIALGYGLIGALIAGVLGGVFAWLASPKLIRACGMGLGALALLLVAMGVWRFTTQRAERRAERGLDVALPPGVDFEIRSSWSEEAPTRSYRELFLDGNDWSFEYVAVGPEAAVCGGTLKAAEVTTLLDSLAGVRSRLASGEELCSGLSEVVIFTVDYDGEGGDWSGEAGFGCTQRERELMAVGTVLGRIPLNALDDGRLNCDL